MKSVTFNSEQQRDLTLLLAFCVEAGLCTPEELLMHRFYHTDTSNTSPPTIQRPLGRRLSVFLDAGDRRITLIESIGGWTLLIANMTMTGGKGQYPNRPSMEELRHLRELTLARCGPELPTREALRLLGQPEIKEQLREDLILAGNVRRQGIPPLREKLYPELSPPDISAKQNNKTESILEDATGQYLNKWFIVALAVLVSALLGGLLIGIIVGMIKVAFSLFITLLLLILPTLILIPVTIRIIQAVQSIRQSPHRANVITSNDEPRDHKPEKAVYRLPETSKTALILQENLTHALEQGNVKAQYEARTALEEHLPELERLYLNIPPRQRNLKEYHDALNHLTSLSENDQDHESEYQTYLRFLKSKS